MTETDKDIIMRIRHVSKLYGSNKAEAVELKKKGAGKDEILKKTGVILALWDVSLEIERGRIMAIIGLSGSGKSTLVRCLNRLNRPSSGDVLFEGKDLAKMSKKELIELRRPGGKKRRPPSSKWWAFRAWKENPATSSPAA